MWLRQGRACPGPGAALGWGSAGGPRPQSSFHMLCSPVDDSLKLEESWLFSVSVFFQIHLRGCAWLPEEGLQTRRLHVRLGELSAPREPQRPGKLVYVIPISVVCFFRRKNMAHTRACEPTVRVLVPRWLAGGLRRPLGVHGVEPCAGCWGGGLQRTPRRVGTGSPPSQLGRLAVRSAPPGRWGSLPPTPLFVGPANTGCPLPTLLPAPPTACLTHSIPSYSCVCIRRTHIHTLTHSHAHRLRPTNS